MKALETYLVVLLVGAFVCVGCGDEDSDDVASGDMHSEEHGVDEEGCEHMGEGPATAVTGAMDATATLPGVKDDHMRYDIALTDVGGMNVGVVTFNADEAGDFVFFLNTSDVPLTVVNQGDNMPVAPEASEDPFDHCAEVAVSHTFDLEVGGYTLTFGPTSATEVQIVVEHGGEAHAHEE